MGDLPDYAGEEDIDEEVLREFIAEQITEDTLIRDAFSKAKKRQ